MASLENEAMLVIRASRPVFRNNHDKVAFAVHASFVASGYLLTAVGPGALIDSAFSSSSADEVATDGWNSMDEEYAFVYHNPEKSKKVLVKCISMNDNLLIDALEYGGSEPAHVHITSVDEYGTDEKGGSNYKDQYKNFSGLIKNLEKELISKFKSYKPTALADKSSSSSSSRGGERPAPTYIGPDRTDLTGGNPFFSPGFVQPPVPMNPYNDLYPGAPPGTYPNRGGIGDGSNLVGPNDPRWFGGPGLGNPGFRGGLPPGVPPGARFDPFGPPDVPGFEPDRFIRHPRRPGGGTNHPDLEQFPGGSDFI